MKMTGERRDKDGRCSPDKLDSSAVDSNPRLETEVKRFPLLKVVQRGWRVFVVLAGGVCKCTLRKGFMGESKVRMEERFDEV